MHIDGIFKSEEPKVQQQKYYVEIDIDSGERKVIPELSEQRVAPYGLELEKSKLDKLRDFLQA